MHLEYDWTALCWRPRFGRIFIDVRGERSWPTFKDAKAALEAAGLTIGKQTASRS